MEKKQLWYSLGIGAFALLAAVGFFIYTTGFLISASPAAEVQGEFATLSIQGGYDRVQIAISSGETALEALHAADAADANLHLSTKEYSGLGTLVDAMYGMKNGTDQKYWQYKVNGVMPQIGADAYTLKNGDAIEWYFASSQE